MFSCLKQGPETNASETETVKDEAGVQGVIADVGSPMCVSKALVAVPDLIGPTLIFLSLNTSGSKFWFATTQLGKFYQLWA